MPVVYIGIGSNLGDREDNCAEAVRRLDANGVRVVKCSAVYETEPWGLKDQPKFVNMAVEAETGHSPRGLLAVVKKIESEMGRRPGVKWGPRLIDLDILLYGDLVVEETDLSIPHPLMHRRNFVLEPLSEIAPEKTHPVLKKKIVELLRENSPHGGTKPSRELS